MKPSDLNPLQALLLVAAVGAVLSRDGDGLNISKRMEEAPPELLGALRSNKAALLAILPEQSGGLSWKS